jgi:hypothetical protein
MEAPLFYYLLKFGTTLAKPQQIKGNIPSQLLTLPNLMSLSLQSNELEGTILTTFLQFLIFLIINFPKHK